MNQVHGGRLQRGNDSTAMRLASDETLAELHARIVDESGDAVDAPNAASSDVAVASEPLRALHHHDGLALIAQERRALHATRRILVSMNELALSAAWPATNDVQRTDVQLELRQQLGDLRDLIESARFRGLRLLAGDCPMIGIQAAPDAGEFIVIGLRDTRPEALGLSALDVSTASGARVARDMLRTAIAAIDLAQEIVVSDLHELLA